jgi:hypothetical protein
MRGMEERRSEWYGGKSFKTEEIAQMVIFAHLCVKG